VVISSVACGLVIDTLLIVNNYRDRDTDVLHSKRTLVTIIGKRASETLFLLLAVVAVFLGLPFLFQGHYLAFLLPFVYLILHVSTYRKMKRISHGKALNLILGENARNMFFYGILFSLGMLLG
jgi:1,4-dihydroxy-2-naphthoate octaprenyltransferase